MTATHKSHSPGPNGHTGGRGPVGGLRRRVTDIPREVEEWFTGHSRWEDQGAGAGLGGASTSARSRLPSSAVSAAGRNQ
jgi:hypothetical protein